jgi:YidC/Oxa1 family membrane protein insertase
VWWHVLGVPFSWALHSLYAVFFSVPSLAGIGAYGLAIIALTLLIRLVLAPLYQWQALVARRNMEQQRRLSPELAKLRKKYKGDQQALTQATMELYREHGVNPAGGLLGCLPVVIQLPVLSALYYVFFGSHLPDPHFLFIHSLNDTPFKHALLTGLPIPTVTYAIVPVLAALSTFVQSRMMQMPPNPNASEQELQMQQMTQSMQVMMPLMIAYFAVVTPAGLGLYWFISNCVTIIQQYFVNGGRLWPRAGGAG